MQIFKKIILTLLFFLAVPLFLSAYAGNPLPPEPPEEHFYRAKISQIVREEQKEVAGQKNMVQTVRAEIIAGPEKGKSVTLTREGPLSKFDTQKLAEGEEVVVVKSINQEDSSYAFLDHYRLTNVIYILIGFFILIILVAGRKGVGSIVGMIVSVIIILQFIVPQILQGQDPLFISIVGSLGIMVLTLFLAHGINHRTVVALGATSLSLLITGILAYLFVYVASLSGLGSEDMYLLQFGPTALNAKGLLLGGIIIGALGVLDDITTSQAAAVYELSRANKKLEFMDLVLRGYVVGKEHIASLVNTLVLAYAGASLSLFILFVLNPSNQPVWVILNSQIIIEEVIRTIAGSIGLVLAVPFTTILAAWAVLRWPEKK